MAGINPKYLEGVLSAQLGNIKSLVSFYILLNNKNMKFLIRFIIAISLIIAAYFVGSKVFELFVDVYIVPFIGMRPVLSAATVSVFLVPIAIVVEKILTKNIVVNKSKMPEKKHAVKSKIKHIVAFALVIILVFGGLLQAKKSIIKMWIGDVSSNPSNCETKDSGFKDKCYIYAAIGAKNSAICEKIELVIGDENSQDACYSNLAETVNNPALCEKIHKANDRGSRNICYYNLARNNQDVHLCQNIKNVQRDKDGINYDIDYCLMAIAIDKIDFKVCDSISKKSAPAIDASQDRCYADIAIQKKDKFLCEKAGAFKEECLANIY